MTLQPDYDVIIVGGGIAGLGMAMRLADTGKRFLLIERGSTVGGTWRDNTYPGIACDVPSHLYSYSFAPNPYWSRRFAPGREIQNYLEKCFATSDLAARTCFDTTVTAASWKEHASRWSVTLNHRGVRREIKGRSLVLATGRLTEPQFPDIPGLGATRLPITHTARWDVATVTRGMRVGVLGTGASSVQLVPTLVRAGARVTVFQRNAAWVLPRNDHAYSEKEKDSFAHSPHLLKQHRDELFAEAEKGYRARSGDKLALATLRHRAIAHLSHQVTNSALRRQLTPRYEIGCKRVTLSDDWYPSLTHEGTRLVTVGVRSVQHRGITTADGTAHPLDRLVLATGFDTSMPPIAKDVVGESGLTLAQYWREGMRAHNSTVVAGFPNMFVLDGPNAALGHNSAVYMIETQIEYAIAAIDHIRSGRTLRVRKEVEQSYVDAVDAAAVTTVWNTGCTSWYRHRGNGRLTLIWPRSAASFRETVLPFTLTHFNTVAKDRPIATPAHGGQA